MLPKGIPFDKIVAKQRLFNDNNLKNQQTERENSLEYIISGKKDNINSQKTKSISSQASIIDLIKNPTVLKAAKSKFNSIVKDNNFSKENDKKRIEDSPQELLTGLEKVLK